MASAGASLLSGFVVGLAVAASPGPIFFLVVRRVLQRGRPSGLASGAGVATADGTYALLAALGLGVASIVLAGQGRWLAAAGGAGLIVLGARTLIARPVRMARASASTGTGLAADYFSTLGLTIANPQTILAFAAVFAGLGATLHRRGLDGAWLVAGVVIGSASWWLVLTLVAGWLRGRLGPRMIAAIRWLSGLVIAAFGLATFAAAVRP